MTDHHLVTSPDQIEQAAERIAGRVRRTPVKAEPGGLRLDRAADDARWRGSCVVKVASVQHTGSFKPRGAFNLLLSRSPAGGVVTASGGNAGLAVAYACSELALPATVFVPSTAPPVKVRRIAELGGLAADSLGARRIGELGFATPLARDAHGVQRPHSRRAGHLKGPRPRSAGQISRTTVPAAPAQPTPARPAASASRSASHSGSRSCP